MININQTRVGTKVTANKRISVVGGYWGETIEPGTTGYVTRIGVSKVLVRFSTPLRERSQWCYASELDSSDETVVVRVPENGIAIDDERIDWIWRMIAAYAEEHGYCSEFDKICADLRIPGRERDHSVSLRVGGITVNARVRARSKDEAQRIFEETLNLSDDND